MNLDSLSFTLSQISYLVANLSKKNFEDSCREISGVSILAALTRLGARFPRGKRRSSFPSIVLSLSPSFPSPRRERLSRILPVSFLSPRLPSRLSPIGRYKETCSFAADLSAVPPCDIEREPARSRSNVNVARACKLMFPTLGHAFSRGYLECLI